jgi:hypothetical protein
MKEFAPVTHAVSRDRERKGFAKVGSDTIVRSEHDRGAVRAKAYNVVQVETRTVEVTSKSLKNCGSITS